MPRPTIRRRRAPAHRPRCDCVEWDHGPGFRCSVIFSECPLDRGMRISTHGAIRRRVTGCGPVSSRKQKPHRKSGRPWVTCPLPSWRCRIQGRYLSDELDMRFDRRRQARRLIDISAKLFTGVDSPVWDCIVMDISNNGARLAVDSVDAIPERFTLLLSSQSRVSHRCRVMWRAGCRMGVTFEATVPAGIEPQSLPGLPNSR
jgi:hypothetical protein